MRVGIATRGARACVRPESGQSTVEFALILPLLVAFLVLLFGVARVAGDQLLVVHAARDAAREATVSSDLARIRTAAQRTLPGASVRVLRRGSVGDAVDVEVSYVTHTEWPVIGSMLPDLTLRAHAVMRVERP